MRYIGGMSAVCALIAAACLAAAIAGCGKGGGKGGGKGEPVSPVDGVISIDASGIRDGEVGFFNYPVRGKSVVFLVARTGSGEIHTAFDACITCYPHGMGYRCESGRVVCAYCGTSFELDELGAGKGNCVPIGIEHLLDGKTVLITRSAIENGAKWF